MAESVFVLDSEKAERELDHLPAAWLRSPDEVAQAFEKEPRAVWLALKKSSLDLLRGATTSSRKPRGRLLVLESIPPHRLKFLHHLFKEVVAGAKLLHSDELWAVLGSANRRDLFIGGIPDEDDQALILYRGDLSSLVVPFPWFESRPVAGSPDWTKFAVTDFGQTLQMGSYEVASDVVLYEWDPDFRRRAKARLMEAADSFGASLRRLRLQRGLRRDEFAPLSAKEIARIERGEVSRPHQKTLRVLAEKLGVEPDEIATY